MVEDSPDIHRALSALGELLEHVGDSHALVILGGTALTLQGLVSRATKDVDVVGMAQVTDGRVGEVLPPPNPLPSSLLAAVSRVARDFGLPADWLNVVAAAQWRTGMPPGFATRIHWTRMGGLLLGLLDRRDLIFFKLYAAADATGPASKHYQDLLALGPSDAELLAAVAWARTQDVSTEFDAILKRVADHVRVDLQEDS